MIATTIYSSDGPPLDYTNKEIKKIEGRIIRLDNRNPEVRLQKKRNDPHPK